MTNKVGMSEKATKVARFLGNARNDKVGAFGKVTMAGSVCRTPSLALKDDGTGVLSVGFFDFAALHSE
jgi:hypothetical protein